MTSYPKTPSIEGPNMDNVRIDSDKKPVSRSAKIVGAVIGGFICVAALAIVASLTIWALVAIWRGITG